MARTLTRIPAALLCAGSWAACSSGGDKTQTDELLQALQGTWVSCVNEGATADQMETLTISGNAVTIAQSTFPSTDATCTGTATDAGTTTSTFTLGGAVPATIGVGGSGVSARAIDVTPMGSASFYSIVYLDAAASPDVLYTGDERVDPARDATAPDKRPNVLQSWKPRYRTLSFAELLQGTWAACATGSSGDVKEQITFNGAGWSGLDTLHATFNGSCSGAVLDSFSFGGTFTIGAAITAPLGATTVTAHAVDLTTTYPVAVTIYDLLYVDSVATPDLMFHGDATGAYDGSTPATRPVALQAALPYRKQ